MRKHIKIAVFACTGSVVLSAKYFLFQRTYLPYTHSVFEESK